MEDAIGEVILKRDYMATYVINKSAEFFDIAPIDLLCNKKHKNKARQRLVMKIMYDELGFRYKEITALLGYKTGSLGNTYYHYHNISEDMKSNKSLQETYKQLLNHLKL